MLTIIKLYNLCNEFVKYLYFIWLSLDISLDDLTGEKMKFEFKLYILFVKVKIVKKISFRDSYNLKYYYLFYYLSKRIRIEQI